MTTTDVNQQLNSETFEDDRLNKFLLVSIAFHIFFFIAFAVRAFFMPSTPLHLERAIRVDMVALPDKPTKSSPPAIDISKPKIEPAPVAKPELPKPKRKDEPDKINLKKTKKEQEAALKRLNAIEKLKKMSEGAPSNNSATSTNNSAVIKGNEISAGNSLTGLSKIEHENYTELVHDQVKRHWNLPQWMANSNLSAVVRVFVDSRGGLVKKELVRSSQNSVFDQSAMTAVDAALPLPKPPDHLVSLISVRGIEIEFVPSEN